MTLLRHGEGLIEELGEVAQLRGRAADAVSLFDGSVAILQKIPDPWLAVVPIGNLAKIAADKGHYDQADEYWRRCLVLLESLEDDYLISYVLEDALPMRTYTLFEGSVVIRHGPVTAYELPSLRSNSRTRHEVWEGDDSPSLSAG